MNLDLTNEETAVLLRELNGLIDGDRYFLSPRIKTLKVIRAKNRPVSIGAQKGPRIGVQQGPLCVGGKGLSR